MMNKRVELPIIEPAYSTYHHQCASSAIIARNPSIRNWVLNNNVILYCNRRFLNGFTTPQISVEWSQYENNPHLENRFYDLRTEKKRFSLLVRELIDKGYYIYYNNIDDYYLDGKTWYHERHFFHDGIICGYDMEDKTYCVHAYDNKWLLRKIWIPQSSFSAGIRAMKKAQEPGYICALRPKTERVEFNVEMILENLKVYLNSSFRNYPKRDEGDAQGIVVHDFMAIYLDKLMDGSIPYERMDWRIFRVIWEHKKIMLERIERLEAELGINHRSSAAYCDVVALSDNIRMLYASYHMRRRDSILPVIKEKLLTLKEKEKRILKNLIRKIERNIKDDTLELH